MKRFYSSVTLQTGLRTILIAFVFLTICGCGTTLRVGRLPDTARLDQLSINVATKVDVMQLLGKPKNGGRVMFPHEPRPKDLWCYYYEESTLSDSQRIFLFVFFDQERYAGYMWFSSLPQSTHH
jgi:hypothetical protein